MEWFSFMIFGLLIVISPGADFVLVFKNSVLFGRKAGALTAVGIGIGVCIHVTYSIVGISQLVLHNAWLFSMIKYAGAGYLVYLGINGLLHSKFKLQQPEPNGVMDKPDRHSKYLVQGFFCNLLNPKTMLFFLSVFSQLISTDQGNHSLFVLGYGVYIAALHVVWFALVAYMMTSKRASTVMNRFGQRINQLCGIGLITFGALLSTNS